MSETVQTWLIYLGGALGFVAICVALGFAWKYKASIGWMSAVVAVWVVIAGIFITVYVHQLEIAAPPAPAQQPAAADQPSASTPPASGQPTAAAAVPSPTVIESDASSIRILAGADGHFRVDGLVNGATVRFLVDTGASGVLLTPKDARRAGIDPDGLQYNQKIITANGQVQGAAIVIYQLAVGPIRLVNVAGAVDKANTDMSLLGMSFLSRLSGYEVSGDTMTLHR